MSKEWTYSCTDRTCGPGIMMLMIMMIVTMMMMRVSAYQHDIIDLGTQGQCSPHDEDKSPVINTLNIDNSH